MPGPKLQANESARTGPLCRYTDFLVLELRTFTRKEMGPPQVVKRFDGLYEVVLTRSAQERPFLVPRLEDGFFGIPDGEAAAAAIKKCSGGL